MSKQKSYTVTDAADGMLGELAEASGLPKSATLEVLIRQAHAAKWSVAVQRALEPEPSIKEEIGTPIDFNMMREYIPSHPGYGAMVRFAQERGIATWEGLAKHGSWTIGLQRGFGQASKDNLIRLYTDLKIHLPL